MRALAPDRPAVNVVIRHIAFEDAYDDWPSWDPKDSFSIAAADFGVGQCSAVFDAATDTGPHQCPSRKGGRWNSEYDKTSLIGGSDTPQRFATTRNGVGAVLSAGPGQLSVTFHHNLFENSTQRMPRVRFGKAHVFNNVFLGQMKPSGAGRPEPTYVWSAGYTISTASKLFVESNVFEIRPGAAGDTLPGAAKLTFGDTVASTLANQTKCVAAGYSAADCGTYFFESGTLLNGSLVPPGSTLAAAQAKGGGASNAAVILLDGTYWTPGQDYSYSTDEVTVVKGRVQAGAGKL